MNDITTRADIEQFVNSFYEKVNQDELLSPVFNDFAEVDWEKHLPTMYSFWETLLFDERTYSGRPFPPHTFLPVTAYHFERWVALFKKNIDEHFQGTTAEEAKLRATTIAHVFQNRLGIIPLVIPEELEK
ncbi:MAG TPA: group III truncated hemoglobin [Patescibacteria group bacterium]|nr:group III truncated hemoglobin [Patescibacteria group bacterium]